MLFIRLIYLQQIHYCRSWSNRNSYGSNIGTIAEAHIRASVMFAQHLTEYLLEFDPHFASAIAVRTSVPAQAYVVCLFVMRS